MSTIILHIGAGKCGSSAIQEFLKLNHLLLRKNGVFIPSLQLTPDQSKVAGHQVWYFQELLQLDLSKAQASLRNNLKHILDTVPPNNCKKIVVSAENLSNPGAFPQILKVLKERCEVQIIFYIRRQDDFFISSWQQWFLKTSGSFNDWVKNQTGRLGDWNAVVQRWEALYGKENINVRRFVRKHLLDGDVVKDFIAAADLPSLDYIYAENESNRTYDDSVGYIAHAARDLFDDFHDNRLYKMFEEHGGPKIYRNRRGSSLMTLEQRRVLLQAYKEGNDRLKRAYLDDDQPIFPPPTSDDVIELGSDEILQSEISMLARVLFGMYQEIRRLRKEVSELRDRK